MDSPGIDEISVYSARGNVYAIASPAFAYKLCGVPCNAPEAADFLLENGARFANAVLERIPAAAIAMRQGRSPIDGIVLAPFRHHSPFDAVIINTDGTLAERSGNGLTNLARFLDDVSLIGNGQAFELRVHTGNGIVTETHGQAGKTDDLTGYWLAMGQIGFGASAVHAARDRLIAADDKCFEVPPLRAFDPTWRRSVLVNVGNPHCVTFVDEPSQLPANEDLRSTRYFDYLKEISYKPVSGVEEQSIFRQGINLQWAHVPPEGDAIHARIFERGEGPTDSSGTSATAITSAAHHIGLTRKTPVRVIMPGGTAVVEVSEMPSGTVARYFGVAERSGMYRSPHNAPTSAMP
jgi:diaminopimelate epimerase